MPKPWEKFYNDAETAISGILISHKKRNKITTNSLKKLYDNKGKVRKSDSGKILYSKGKSARGQLHEESFFGKHTDPSGVEYFHITKPLENIETKKHINEIVDVGIRKVLFAHLNKLGINTEQENFSIHKDTFFKYDESGKKIPQVFLPNKNGEPVPIKKVRKREIKRNAFTVNEEANKWVEPGNNDHLAIYEKEDGTIFEKIVTFWEAVERIKNSMPVVDIFPKDGSKFVASFKENDLFIVGLNAEEINDKLEETDKLSEHLYRVQKISTSGYKIVLRKHTAANLDDDTQMIGIESMQKFKELNPVKVIA